MEQQTSDKLKTTAEGFRSLLDTQYRIIIGLENRFVPFAHIGQIFEDNKLIFRCNGKNESVLSRVISEIPACCLLVTGPQTPEIIACGRQLPPRLHERGNQPQRAAAESLD